MLVLSRKRGESIVLGQQIEVTITSVHENRVSIGIKAPDSVAVRRAELTALTRKSISTQDRQS